jgi:hypothetical protein
LRETLLALIIKVARDFNLQLENKMSVKGIGKFLVHHYVGLEHRVVGWSRSCVRAAYWVE